MGFCTLGDERGFKRQTSWQSVYSSYDCWVHRVIPVAAKVTPSRSRGLRHGGSFKTGIYCAYNHAKCSQFTVLKKINTLYTYIYFYYLKVTLTISPLRVQWIINSKSVFWTCRRIGKNDYKHSIIPISSF